MDRDPCVYLLASRRHGTIYTGVTSDLPGRLWKHRNGVTRGFAGRYAVLRLVHFEMLGDMDRAIAREKQIKNWRRSWKIALIEAHNPDWNDLPSPSASTPSPATPPAPHRESRWRNDTSRAPHPVLPGSTRHP